MMIATFAQVACLWEATARKPGNVHCRRDFRDLHYTDFLASAAAIGPAFAQAPSRPIGETVPAAIRATREVVSTNTNLGMVLLLAPLAAVPPNEPFRSGVERLLSELTIDDSRNVFEAIRLAHPGGLGQVEKEDVHAAPTQPLRAIMMLAADRDLVARQYANGFREVFEEGVPDLQRHLLSGYGVEEAIVLTHVGFIARHPDSLIVRKHGLPLAEEASRRANEVLTAERSQRAARLEELDRWLCERRANPGTSADLVTACLFIVLREGIMTLPLQHPWSSGWNHG